MGSCPPDLWASKFVHNPSIWYLYSCFFCSFPPHVTKSSITLFALYSIVLFISCTFVHTFCLFAFTSFISSLYTSFFLFSLSFLHSVFVFFYIFSFFYYSPVSSSTSPSVSSPYCSSLHAPLSTSSTPLLLHPLSPPYIPRFPSSPYFYILPSSSSLHICFLLFSLVFFHFIFNFFSILLSSSNLSLYRVTSKWMKSNSSFLITRSSTDQLFTRA